MDWTAFLTGAAGGVASGLVIPIIHGNLAWRIEQRRWARQKLHDSVARIATLADGAATDFAGRFSLTVESPSAAVNEAIGVLRSLNADCHKLSLYLPTKEADALSQFLEASQEVLDEANDTWQNWHPDDPQGEDSHHVGTLGRLSKAATPALAAIKHGDRFARLWIG